MRVRLLLLFARLSKTEHCAPTWLRERGSLHPITPCSVGSASSSRLFRASIVGRMGVAGRVPQQCDVPTFISDCAIRGPVLSCWHSRCAEGRRSKPCFWSTGRSDVSTRRRPSAAPKLEGTTLCETATGRHSSKRSTYWQYSGVCSQVGSGPVRNGRNLHDPGGSHEPQHTSWSQ